MNAHVAPTWPSEVDALDEVDAIEAKADPTVVDLERLDVLVQHPSSLVRMSASVTARAIRSAPASAQAPQAPQVGPGLGADEADPNPIAPVAGSDVSLAEGYTAEQAEQGTPPRHALDPAGQGQSPPPPAGDFAPRPLPCTLDQPITSSPTLVDEDVTDMPIASFVAYYRVSTAKQGASGLGLDAQRAAVKAYLGGRDGRIVGEFVEVESGRNSERPELARALAAARLHRAAVVVANVSRLTRSLAFLSKLLEAGVDVRFCDLPQIEGPTGRFMLQQMAAVAELEAGMIGDRTRKALAAAKARGQKLGGSRGVVLTAEQRAQGRRAQTARSTARAADIRPIIVSLQACGATSLAQIAAALTERGIPTSRGADRWSPIQVSRVLKAAKIAGGPAA